jgi:hypothetical protein
MGNILRQGRFADSVGADQDCVGGVVEEFERHQGFDGGLVAFLWPRPIEVAQRFEAADMRIFEAALQAATCSLLLLPFDEVVEPSGGGGVVPMGEQAVEAQCLGSGMQDIEVIHRTSP